MSGTAPDMTADDARVTTVVISRNRCSQLMQSMEHHDPPVILVDNGSTDDTVEAVSRRFPHVQVIALGENLGSPARNIGVEAATTPYVAFADDDSWWAEGALSRIAVVLDQHPDVGLVAGRMLVGPEERLDPLCAVMERSPLRRGPGEPGTPVLGFMACAAVVRREAYLQAGGFDEVTFFAGEEDRLAWDMAANGWVLVYRPDAVAHHHPGRGTDRHARERLVMRNALLTAAMRRPWPVVLRQVVRLLRSGAAGAGALVDALPRLRGALSRRRRLPAGVESRVRLLDSGP
jgi:GT2 family glycosyltransferase